jgi:hypothetical protein
MSRRDLEQIRQAIRNRQYDLTAHAFEEMSEDLLDVEDVEIAVQNGQIVKVEKGDPRGTRYVVEGLAADGVTPVGVVGRFTSTSRYLIVTVYEITEPEG